MQVFQKNVEHENLKGQKNIVSKLSKLKRKFKEVVHRLDLECTFKMQVFQKNF